MKLGTPSIVASDVTSPELSPPDSSAGTDDDVLSPPSYASRYLSPQPRAPATPPPAEFAASKRWWEAREEWSQVHESVLACHEASLAPLTERFGLDEEAPNPTVPLVLLLGNHSSGKSSFINHLVGSKDTNTFASALNPMRLPAWA